MTTRSFAILAIALSILVLPNGAQGQEEKRRVFVVSSYHKEYLWSQSTQLGLVDALLKYGYLDNKEQGDAFTKNDEAESSKAVFMKVWMDTKRRYDRPSIARKTAAILKQMKDFAPDIVLLGDDNAANYIGNQLLDTETPVVFWGINGLPLKYGLVDSMDNPGHNITGVWQAGYHKESLTLLNRLIPEAKTFAIIACDSVSSRPNIKQIQFLAKRGKLPLELVDTVATNSYSEFKTRVLELSKTVDAFFILNHDTLVDDEGEHVDMLEVGNWYLKNIKKPEASNEGQFVLEGMLLTANDAGYNQSFTAFEMAYDILEQGLSPARMRTRTPQGGAFMVNKMRAQELGIDLTKNMYVIDELIETSAALQVTH